MKKILQKNLQNDLSLNPEIIKNLIENLEILKFRISEYSR